jgi:hypothetical protein
MGDPFGWSLSVVQRLEGAGPIDLKRFQPAEVNVPDDAVRELDAHGAFVGVDVEDDASVAVADAEPRVVAQRHYSAACLYRDASHVKRRDRSAIPRRERGGVRGRWPSHTSSRR